MTTHNKLCVFGLLIVVCASASAQWKYETTKDTLTDKALAVATLQSTAKFNLGVPQAAGADASIRLRPRTQGTQRTTDVLITASKGLIPGNRTVQIKFDDAETVSFDLYGTSYRPSNTVFLRYYGKIDGCTPGEMGPARPGESSLDWIKRYTDRREACEMDDKKLVKRISEASRIRLALTLEPEGERVFEFKPQGLQWEQPNNDSNTKQVSSPPQTARK